MLTTITLASSSFVQPSLPRTVVPMRSVVSMATAEATASEVLVGAVGKVVSTAPAGFEWGYSTVDGFGTPEVKSTDTSTLKKEGLAAIDARSAAQQGLKVATLKYKGAAAVEARAQMQQSLKIATLKQQGAAVVKARAEMQETMRAPSASTSATPPTSSVESWYDAGQRL